MATFSIAQGRTDIAGSDAVLLRLAFGEPASNDVMVREAARRMRTLMDEGLTGGKLILLNGAASLPVIAVIVHHVAHLFGAVGIFDPKLNGYVVVVSHDPLFALGDLLRDERAAEEGNA